jgi:hypothetical protein
MDEHGQLHHSPSQPPHQPLSQPLHQPLHQSTSQPTTPSTTQPTTPTITQSTTPTINHSIDHSINHSTNQSVNHSVYHSTNHSSSLVPYLLTQIALSTGEVLHKGTTIQMDCENCSSCDTLTQDLPGKFDYTKEGKLTKCAH